MLLVVFKTLCGMSILLTCIPFVWHTKNRNIPAICLSLWLIVFNLFSFMNAFIWPDDDMESAWDGNIFCDIQIKLMIASGAGLLGAIAAIARNLANIMSNKINVIRTKSVRRRQIIVDLSICLGAPIWMISVHYIVQPNRYDVLSITGCAPSAENSWPSILLLFIWPPIVALFSAYYAGLVLCRLHKYRQDFSDILRASSSGLTKSRFIRLFLLSLILVVIFFPVTLYIFYRNISVETVPYSWKRVHGAEWNHINKIPTGGAIQFDRWIPIFFGFMLFFFFGLGHDALTMYRGWADSIGLGRYLGDYIMGRYRTPGVTGSSRSTAGFFKSLLSFSSSEKPLVSLSSSVGNTRTLSGTIIDQPTTSPIDNEKDKSSSFAISGYECPEVTPTGSKFQSQERSSTPSTPEWFSPGQPEAVLTTAYAASEDRFEEYGIQVKRDIYLKEERRILDKF